MKPPAYYARSDLLAVLHPPYTAWHVSYVGIGAALASRPDWVVLGGTLLAFVLGTGLGAHALDELNGRPLHTRLSDRTLWILVVVGFGGGVALAVIGAVVVSPWVLAWAVTGTLLAVGYAREWRFIHTDIGFGLAWGGFPTIVGYWAQTKTLGVGVVAVAVATTLLSLTQRRLSTPARYVRRSVQRAEVMIDTGGGEEIWPERRLLESWEKPLRLLGWAMMILAAGLLTAAAARIPPLP